MLTEHNVYDFMFIGTVVSIILFLWLFAESDERQEQIRRRRIKTHYQRLQERWSE